MSFVYILHTEKRCSYFPNPLNLFQGMRPGSGILGVICVKVINKIINMAGKVLEIDLIFFFKLEFSFFFFGILYMKSGLMEYWSNIPCILHA